MVNIIHYLLFAIILIPSLNGQGRVVINSLYKKNDSLIYFNNKIFTGVAYSKTLEGKRLIESNYLRGILNGTHTEWWQNQGIKIHGRYKSGLKYGRWVEYYENGIIQSEENYKKGLRDGFSSSWYDNGEKKAKGEFYQGKKLGVWHYWDKNGEKIEYVCIKTMFGEIKIKLFPKIAPLHVDNFKTHIESGYYDKTIFHRAVPGFVIQGGDPNSKSTNRKIHGMGGEASNFYGIGNKKQTTTWRVPAEFSDMSHIRGIVSMARGYENNSAGSQFFICVNNAESLDGKYTIFGKVIAGMDVVDAIVSLPVDGRDNPINRVEMKILMCN
tara:strand:- start:489 stop:1466 length:978 start_codon:yes stop_codon:yes gene_type:complete